MGQLGVGVGVPSDGKNGEVNEVAESGDRLLPNPIHKAIPNCMLTLLVPKGTINKVRNETSPLESILQHILVVKLLPSKGKNWASQ